MLETKIPLTQNGSLAEIKNKVGQRVIEVEDLKTDRRLGCTRNQAHQNECSLFYKGHINFIRYKG